MIGHNCLDVMHIAGLSHPSIQGARPQVTIGSTNQLLMNEKETRKKVSFEEDDDLVILEKSNILMLGPTGSGKNMHLLVGFKFLFMNTTFILGYHVTIQ